MESDQFQPALEVSFRAGNIASHYQKWKCITSDPYVLSAVKGFDLDFENEPIGTTIIKNKEFSPAECAKVELEIDRLKSIGAITLLDRSKVKFSSPIFLAPKSDGSARLILNVKKLNTFLKCPHFKMDDIRSVCNLVREGDFLCKVDLKDAFLSVPVAHRTSSYLCFEFQGSFYCYRALPFGLCMSPYIFTKVLKPVAKALRAKGVQIILYLDDALIISKSLEQCTVDVQEVILTFQSLGFTVNVAKSVTVPSQSLEYLGLLVSSRPLELKLPQRKVDRVVNLCTKAISNSTNTIQSFAQLQGTLISCCPAVPYGLLFTRNLAAFLANELRASTGDYSFQVTLPSECIADLRWWLRQAGHSTQRIRSDKFDKIIYTDASLSGYGGYCEGQRLSGHWTTQEHAHINTLELLAVEKALHYFCQSDSRTQILLRVDSTTAVSYTTNLVEFILRLYSQ